MMPTVAMFVTNTLVHLAPVDIVIVAFYFALVLGIGFYLRGRRIRAKIFSWQAGR